MTQIDVTGLSSREGAQHLAKQVGGDFLFDGSARRNAGIAQRVAPLASRNGKVIFPRWPRALVRTSPSEALGCLERCS